MSGIDNSPAAESARTVYEMFAAAAATSPDRPFLVVPSCSERAYLQDGAEFTYAQALAEINAVAALYRQAGYGPRHRVALVVGNRPEHFWHFLALNALGACAVPLNPDYLPHEFAHGLRQASVSLVIMAGEAGSRVRAGAAELSPAPAVVDLDAGEFVIPAPSCPAVPAVDDAEERAALIIYTSGTTSRPKGCMISNSSCLASGRSYVDVGGLLTLEPDVERLYVPLPTFHMNACVLALNAMLRQRGCLIVTDRFRASRWWAEIRETRATGVHYLGLIPPILLKMPHAENEGAPTVKFGLGAGVDPVLHAPFEERFGFPLIEVWGMTETSRLIANASEPRRTDTRAFGKPHAPLEVLVADDDDRPVAVGQSGQLLVRCAGSDPRSGFFSGYVNDAAATEEAWQNGWFHTGDVVRQDDDGMLYFVERRKNIIRRSGENIAAAEIEEALIGDPFINGVVVLAVVDPIRDEEPLACVVLSEGRTPCLDEAKRIFDESKATLASHKLPGWIQFIQDIPVTATQKVRKDVLLASFDPSNPNAFDMRPFKTRKNTSNQA
ncbi:MULTISPECIES: AMP-binding protein [Sphingobium]|jgi:acyl-CoA synthetase (AMP-forming)/AMP-acid ligase II|uniref:AMP-binding protein n=2 Tax=Sphingobium TaxID=165695 RepID=A0A975KAX5_9SPHN|nr:MULTISPECIES: AMP-binding protein [Sphingobium]QUT07263.1 AMP-binding protein [Sphingobium phenoxybenzoativorans]GAY21942.1 long-chain-fatty-acid--CoA ligase [Sphingobium fuliginis]